MSPKNKLDTIKQLLKDASPDELLQIERLLTEEKEEREFNRQMRKRLLDLEVDGVHPTELARFRREVFGE